MSIIYVTEPGALLRLRDGRLLLTRGALTLADEPLMKVEQIVLAGNVGATTPLISHCMENGVDIAYVSSSGAFRGRMQAAEHNNVSIRIAQYDRRRDQLFCLRASRQIASGKIGNQSALLNKRHRPEAAILQQVSRRAANALDLDKLRGHEGSASAIYFRSLVSLIPKEVGFDGRRSRPAEDAVNSALNLGYTLLYKNVAASLSLAGLDPFLGCLHGTRRGHAALASDLMEEWRPVLVDTVMLTMMMRREVTCGDFTQTDAGVCFKRPALRKFLARFEARLSETALYPAGKAKFSYRQMLDLQARHFRRVVQGNDDSYKPFRWDW